MLIGLGNWVEWFIQKHYLVLVIFLLSLIMVYLAGVCIRLSGVSPQSMDKKEVKACEVERPVGLPMFRF